MASASPAPSPFGSPASTRSSLHLAPPTASSHAGGHDLSALFNWKDPRTSSMQSLVPSLASDTDEDDGGADGGRSRMLLVVYIHGYNGNNQSFRSFPAHVHQYLKVALEDSHRVHSKIYPRYKTYRAMQVGVENFSDWLTAAEGDATDVVLVGHSMGGILAGEVVLMPNTNPYGRHPYKHRILGMVGMDTPYLGLHPGIISAGLSSIFRPAPEGPKSSEADVYNAGNHTTSAPDLGRNPSGVSTNASLSTQTSSTSELASLATTISSQSQDQEAPQDPLFDPKWSSDTVYKERPFLKGMTHFAKKHFSEGVLNAAAKHFLSHMEYCQTLIDYAGLTKRYENLRVLEDVDDLKELASPEQITGPSFQPKPARVRFANYYTISTGIPKKPKPESVPSETHLRPEDAGEVSADSQVSTPRISIEGPDGEIRPDLDTITAGSFDKVSTTISTNSILSPVDETEEETDGKGKENDRTPLEGSQETATAAAAVAAAALKEKANEGLPNIPPEPSRPPTVNLDQYTDKEMRKQAEKEAKRLQKAYDQAVKDRAKAIKERARISEKRRRKAAKEAERRREKEEAAAAAQVRTVISVGSDMNLDGTTHQSNASSSTMALASPSSLSEDPAGAAAASSSSLTKSKRERKFCNLPKKSDGRPDEAWIRIFMKDVDEVGAHCGLFFPGEHYHTLVSDVAERIVGWVHEDMSRREIARLMEDGGD